MIKTMLLTHAAVTLFLVGLIWTIQVVHYPLFAQVGREGFRQYESEHQRLTSWVVGPPMIVEFVACLLLLWWQPAAIPTVSLWVGFAVFLLAMIPVLTHLLRMERTPQSVAEQSQAVGMLGRHWSRAQTLRHWLFWLMVPAILAPSAWSTAFFFQQVHKLFSLFGHV